VNREDIISQLEQQRDNVSQAIAALRGAGADRRRGRKRRRMSAEARQKISQAKRKWWAQLKKK
jgi:hypothetical protein